MADLQIVAVSVSVPVGVAVVIILIICCYYRRRRNRFDYTALEEHLDLPAKKARENDELKRRIRDAAQLQVEYHLRSTGTYGITQPLPTIGSRLGRHWFVVEANDPRRNFSGAPLLLSCISLGNPAVELLDSNFVESLKDICVVLQHPYVFPVADVDIIRDQSKAIFVHPMTKTGSLKDFIHQSNLRCDYAEKYRFRGKSLTQQQIQTYGKQILQGTIFLISKGFPEVGHIRAGNILFDNNVCRVSGYENQLVGLKPTSSSTFGKQINKGNLDAFSFGHLLYEMSSGSELEAAQPGPQHLSAVPYTAVIEVLNFIFKTTPTPSLEQIRDHAFFSHVNLPELSTFNQSLIHMTDDMKNVLKLVKKGKLIGKKGKKGNSSKSKPSDRKKNRVSRTQDASRSSTPATPTTPHLPSGGPLPPGPPPPAPPPPPPPPSDSSAPAAITSPSSERSALLGDIRKGTMLKKTATNDRSKPRV